MLSEAEVVHLSMKPVSMSMKPVYAHLGASRSGCSEPWGATTLG